jgi:hypothetical protein
VVHVLVNCPKLRELGEQLRGKIEAFSDVAGMIGGRSHDSQTKPEDGPINRNVLNAVLDFAGESKRSMSRAPKRPQNRAGDRGFNTGPHELKLRLHVIQ